MANLNKNQKGISIIGVLFFGVLLVLVLSYSGISIKSIVESPEGQENINYITGGVRNLWYEYLKEPAEYIWNDIIIGIVWENLISAVGNLRNMNSINLGNFSPDINY